MQRKSVNKRKHRGLRLLLVLAVLLGALAADSGLRLVTTEYVLKFSTLPEGFDGFRIVQLSDLHSAVFGENNRRLLRAVAEAAPELIVITGDLADQHTDLTQTDLLLAGLVRIAPVYYVSGNHEWSEGLLEPLEVLFEKHGVIYLRNEAVSLERGEDAIVLAGVEDPNGWRDMLRPDALAAEIRAAHPEEFVLLLAHRNDWPEKYPALPVDLILCGHAHGGIIRIPGVGGLLGTGRDLFPEYDAGVFCSGEYKMLVSRGLGSGNPIPRLLNNPEVVAVTLKKV